MGANQLSFRRRSAATGDSSLRAVGTERRGCHQFFLSLCFGKDNRMSWSMLMACVCARACAPLPPSTRERASFLPPLVRGNWNWWAAQRNAEPPRPHPPEGSPHPVNEVGAQEAWILQSWASLTEDSFELNMYFWNFSIYFIFQHPATFVQQPRVQGLTRKPRESNFQLCKLIRPAWLHSLKSAHYHALPPQSTTPALHFNAPRSDIICICHPEQ